LAAVTGLRQSYQGAISNQTIALTSASLPVFKSNFFMCVCRVSFI
jgi:hypothetical protein